MDRSDPHRRSAARVLGAGALVVGILDILDAFVFFGIRSGVAPTRILQSIAAGLLGRASFEHGLRSAALGLVLHFTIATGIVLSYHAAARRLPVLRKNVLVLGPLYGLAVYAFMNFVVIPLSASPRGTPPPPVVLNGILIHIFGVGIPAVWFARKALAARS